MPASTRRQARGADVVPAPLGEEIRDDSRTEIDGLTDETIDSHEVEYEDEEDAEEDGPEEDGEDLEPEPFPPPGLKEISSLASWTVSTAKPGNGVAALRSPDTSLFWQSDGPQPHLLSIHFFKVVSIVHIRIFLDFDNDESYTPTKIQFLAGMGLHDIQEFAEMTLDRPNGWIDVDFSSVGPIDDDEDAENDDRTMIDWSKRPVLRAFLVQVRILENHQNGKDTHLRAIQLFARDDEQKVTPIAKPKSPAKLPFRHGMRKIANKQPEPNNISLASWMQDPDLR